MATAATRILPLAMGDRLTPDEFLRRWREQPEIARAELIGGTVYMPSPVSRDHGSLDNGLATWVGVYEAATPGCDACNNSTTLLLQDCPQPSALLRLHAEVGGASLLGSDGLIHGSPELIGEICKSSAAYDLHPKLDLYERAGVPEYVAVLVYEQAIRWHRLVGGRYELQSPDADGIWRSRVFPGLWLDGAALLHGDKAALLAKLHEGIASAEHQAFVAELARRLRS